MSACKTGCGVETGGLCLCASCWQLWFASGEYARACAAVNDASTHGATERYDVAQADFCHRVRAERQNQAG